jgi:hypothetical protein
MFGAGCHDSAMTRHTPSSASDKRSATTEEGFVEPLGTDLGGSGADLGWETLATPAEPWPLLPARLGEPAPFGQPPAASNATPARSAARRRSSALPGQDWVDPHRAMADLVGGMFAVVRDEITGTANPVPDVHGAASLLMVLSGAVMLFVCLFLVLTISIGNLTGIAISGALALLQISLFWLGLRRYRRDLA